MLYKLHKIILNIKNEIGKEPFYLDFNSDRDFEGWRYLFQAYGITPSYSKSDEMFGWIYNKEDKEAPKISIYISNDLKKPDLWNYREAILEEKGNITKGLLKHCLI